MSFWHISSQIQTSFESSYLQPVHPNRRILTAVHLFETPKKSPDSWSDLWRITGSYFYRKAWHSLWIFKMLRISFLKNGAIICRMETVCLYSGTIRCAQWARVAYLFTAARTSSRGKTSPPPRTSAWQKTRIPPGIRYFRAFQMVIVTEEEGSVSNIIFKGMAVFNRLLKGDFSIFHYFIQHCFICRPSESNPLCLEGRWLRFLGPLLS